MSYEEEDTCMSYTVVCSTPLGFPVEPLVYSMKSASSEPIHVTGHSADALGTRLLHILCAFVNFTYICGGG